MSKQITKEQALRVIATFRGQLNVAENYIKRGKEREAVISLNTLSEDAARLSSMLR